jgi:hypothetical protein
MRKIYELTYINTENKIARENFNTKEEAIVRKDEVKRLWESSDLYKKVSYYAMVSAVMVR